MTKRKSIAECLEIGFMPITPEQMGVSSPLSQWNERVFHLRRLLISHIEDRCQAMLHQFFESAVRRDGTTEFHELFDRFHVQESADAAPRRWLKDVFEGSARLWLLEPFEGRIPLDYPIVRSWVRPQRMLSQYERPHLTALELAVRQLSEARAGFVESKEIRRIEPVQRLVDYQFRGIAMDELTVTGSVTEKSVNDGLRSLAHEIGLLLRTSGKKVGHPPGRRFIER
ncbi:MAG: hypothetical protein AAF654_10005 [Myxococcota bacterium]